MHVAFARAANRAPACKSPGVFYSGYAIHVGDHLRASRGVSRCTPLEVYVSFGRTYRLLCVEGWESRVPPGVVTARSQQLNRKLHFLEIDLPLQSRNKYFECVAESGVSQSSGPAVPLACKQQRKAFEACCKDSWVCMLISINRFAKRVLFQGTDSSRLCCRSSILTPCTLSSSSMQRL